MEKSLDRKVRRIQEDPSCRDFILADAKDGDMGFGIAAPGPAPADCRQTFKTLEQYRQHMREITQDGQVDIMLMSASCNERLTIQEGLFAESPVTPAVRANDSSDIWLGLSGSYAEQPSRPFRTATIDHIQSGVLDCDQQQRTRGADLGLYSITFNNDTASDLATLTAYREFRLEAERKGFRHFLEVFAPNAAGQRAPQEVGRFVNDHIARTLAGVTQSARPLFLKMPYFGPAPMEALAHYDPTLIIGVLGGSSGTTHDAFQLLWEAKKYGARAALFGRKINHAECQLSFVRFLRRLADGEIEPAEAVRAYHGTLQAQGLAPHRSLDDDLRLSETL